MKKVVNFLKVDNFNENRLPVLSAEFIRGKPWKQQFYPL